VKAWIIALGLLLWLPALGAGTARLTVRSDPAGAHVYLDTLFAGVTPLTVDSPGGTLILRLLGPEPSSWLSAVCLDTLHLRDGQDTTIDYRLRTRYYLNTVPSGAGVFLGDSLAGITPLVFADSLLGSGSVLALRKEGYEEARVGVGELSRGSLIFPLSMLPGGGPVMQAPALGIDSRDHLRLHLSGYSTLFFGLMTAYLKSRADEANQAFLRTQDPAFLARRDRLDHQAAISIIATEIALGLFIYFLLLE
jgi:hypothetical protein